MEQIQTALFSHFDWLVILAILVVVVRGDHIWAFLQAKFPNLLKKRQEIEATVDAKGHELLGKLTAEVESLREQVQAAGKTTVSTLLAGNNRVAQTLLDQIRAHVTDEVRSIVSSTAGDSSAAYTPNPESNTPDWKRWSDTTPEGLPIRYKIDEATGEVDLSWGYQVKRGDSWVQVAAS